MKELLASVRLRDAAMEMLKLISEFMDINSLFVAINDTRTNVIIRTINKDEVLITEGELPFFETYCSLVCNSRNGLFVIPNTQQDSSTSDMDVTRFIGATTFIGVPIVLSDGTAIGTVCGMDRKPYAFCEKEVTLLQTSAKFLAQVIELEHLAYRDKLTGAYTRGYFDEVFCPQLKEHAKFALCVLDVDNFKAINDTHGHLVGDKMLRHVSERIQDLLSANDLLVRIGGDEFLILLPDRGSEEDVLPTLQKLLLELARLNQLTYSIGVSLYPRDGSDIETLIKVADRAMYTVKRSGKNNFLLASIQHGTVRDEGTVKFDDARYFQASR